MAFFFNLLLCKEHERNPHNFLCSISASIRIFLTGFTEINAIVHRTVKLIVLVKENCSVDYSMHEHSGNGDAGGPGNEGVSWHGYGLLPVTPGDPP